MAEAVYMPADNRALMTNEDIGARKTAQEGGLLTAAESRLLDELIAQRTLTARLVRALGRHAECFRCGGEVWIVWSRRLQKSEWLSELGQLHVCGRES